MTFQIIIQNRLQTEEAVATQAHADVVCAIMNRIPRVPSTRFSHEVLKAIEERCVDQPFPHDLRIGSRASLLEDAVFFTKIQADALQKERWLNSWLQPVIDLGMYHFVRDLMSQEEHVTFDLEWDFYTQATFLLLAAHASANVDLDAS